MIGPACLAHRRRTAVSSPAPLSRTGSQAINACSAFSQAWLSMSLNSVSWLSTAHAMIGKPRQFRDLEIPGTLETLAPRQHSGPNRDHPRGVCVCALVRFCMAFLERASGATRILHAGPKKARRQGCDAVRGPGIWLNRTRVSILRECRNHGDSGMEFGFDRDRGCLPAANADRGHASPHLSGPHRTEQCHDDACA